LASSLALPLSLRLRNVQKPDGTLVKALIYPSLSLQLNVHQHLDPDSIPAPRLRFEVALEISLAMKELHNAGMVHGGLNAKTRAGAEWTCWSRYRV
jgi:phage gp29-like protein